MSGWNGLRQHLLRLFQSKQLRPDAGERQKLWPWGFVRTERHRRCYFGFGGVNQSGSNRAVSCLHLCASSRKLSRKGVGRDLEFDARLNLVRELRRKLLHGFISQESQREPTCRRVSHGRIQLRLG